MEKILIVSENKLVCWSLKEILSQEGYAPDVAFSPKDFLAKISSLFYSLVFFDCELRESYNPDIMRKIKEVPPSTRIIILSTCAGEQKKDFVAQPNIFSVIEKPFSLQQIRETAKRALTSKEFKEGSGNFPRT